MTVKELIDKLRNFPSDTDVVNSDNEDIESVELDEDENGSFVVLE